MSKQATCEERIEKEYSERIDDLRTLWHAEDQETDDLGSLYDYGLCIDLVEAGTFEGQREDYVRYQLSYGGPSDEFRIYKNGDVEYWFLDWFDGSHIEVNGENKGLIQMIVEPFVDACWVIDWYG
jgi:hypothetical protein